MRIISPLDNQVRVRPTFIVLTYFANLQEELENLKIRNESRLKFEKKWLVVQAEENDLKCELEEATYKKQIENLKLDINEERRVHAEVLWYYEEEKKVGNLWRI